MRNVSIIVPVYSRVDLVERLLAFISSTISQSAERENFAELVLVNDNPNDMHNIEFLRHWTRHTPLNAILLENEANIGFVASVTRATAIIDRLNHVLIATTDTVPYPGWFDSLTATINNLERMTVPWGSITPFSNFGGLSTIPRPLNDWQNYAGACTPSSLALICKHLFRDPGQVIEVPYNQSFFVILSRKAIEAVGLFAEWFSPGYGEDIDWCCRAHELGFRHFIAPGIFVHHDGRQSFGNGAAELWLSRLCGVNEAKYPWLERAIQQFLEESKVASHYLTLKQFMRVLCQDGSARELSPITLQYIREVLAGLNI